MPETLSIHERVIAKLLARHVLDEDDRATIRALPFEQRTFDASSHRLREGQPPRRCAFLLDGYIYRQKLAVDGRRAVAALQIPGDFIDLQNLLLCESDHDVQALTFATTAEFAVADLLELAAKRPGIGKAMRIDALIEASIHWEWLLNVGRRDARARIAHLLCEFSVRLRAAGVIPEHSYDLPMTQGQLGDALGLTAVHVNRILRSLERDGLIERRKRQIAIVAWPGLRRAADFNERYLHLDQAHA